MQHIMSKEQDVFLRIGLEKKFYSIKKSSRLKAQNKHCNSTISKINQEYYIAAK